MSNLSLLVDCKKIIRILIFHLKNGSKTAKNSPKTGSTTSKLPKKKQNSSWRASKNSIITLNFSIISTTTKKVNPF